MSFANKLPVAAVLAMVLVACGGTSEASDPPAKEPVAQETSSPEPQKTETPAVPTASESGSEEFAGLPEPYASADYAIGKRTFRTCSSCHLLDAGAGSLVGPNLHGMFGRKAGAGEDFKYSKVLAEADFEWTPEKLDEWLANPRGFLPGNNMSFTGVRRERDRKAVIAYLMVETAE